MLNGFHTNAYCVGGGTGGTFADYLFPAWWHGPRDRPQRVGADGDRQGADGVVYRSMGNTASGWVTNIGDYFWGQGPTGPDIRLSNRIGMWSITGTV